MSFRIHEDAGYNVTYEKLIAAVRKSVAGNWWYEPTSFYAFESELGISDLAATLKAAIRSDRDLIILGMPDFKSGRIIGKCDDQDIFKIIPFMKNV
ncbi:hypothetical protein [Novosphingobium olei]|uniref:Uncharacterized protein n=1 Tax=Novosphingobium olei TaxID=2728851 RepID=A0A7Y0BSF6_9SPHN|nr:hypothetical protein [Novosphingobium olei]NML95455.1 hypothetical protein [Novosphingobium olei]